VDNLLLNYSNGFQKSVHTASGLFGNPFVVELAALKIVHLNHWENKTPKVSGKIKQIRSGKKCFVTYMAN
jgi:hypothetical protein